MAGQPTEPTNARKQELANTVISIIRSYEKGNEWGCYVFASEITELYEQLWVWSQLVDYPGIRASIKRFQIAERKYDAENKRNDPE
jgi:hypothetical protein